MEDKLSIAKGKKEKVKLNKQAKGKKLFKVKEK